MQKTKYDVEITEIVDGDQIVRYLNNMESILIGCNTISIYDERRNYHYPSDKVINLKITCR